MIGIRKLNEREAQLRTIDGKLFFANEPSEDGSVYPAIPYIAGDVIVAVWVEVIEACNADALISVGRAGAPNYWGNAMSVDAVGHVTTCNRATFTLNPTEIPDKTSETWEFEIPGVRKADYLNIITNNELADLTLFAEVISNDFVRVTLVNNTGGELDIPSQVITIDVDKAPLGTGRPVVAAESGAINITARSAITTGVIKVSALIYRK